MTSNLSDASSTTAAVLGRGGAAQHLPGQNPGVLAVVHEDLAVDERVVVPAAALHVASGAAREVVFVGRRRQTQSGEVDHVDVGERAGREAATIDDAEQVRCVA